MKISASTLTVCLAALSPAVSHAVTTIVTANVNTNADNRPFFDTAAFGGAITNAAGYSGTATPGVDSVSTISGPSISILGTSLLPDLSDGNGVPYGVVVTLTDVSFTVEAMSGVLSDGGNNGLGIDSSGSGIDPNANNLNGVGDNANINEILKFDSLQFSSATISDPLGQLQAGSTIGTPSFSVLRSNDFSEANEGAIVSSDAAGTTDISGFGLEGAGVLNNNFNDGTFGPLTTAYVTTTSGPWRVKGIGYEVPIELDVQTNPDRRIFSFGGAGDVNEVSSTLTEGGMSINLTAAGDLSGLGTTTGVSFTGSGVGVNSALDDLCTGTDCETRIDGTLSTPEGLQFSFDRDVSLEALRLGNVTGSGEPIELSFVSGTNPFTGLSGYDADGYAIDSDSITFTRDDGGDGGLFVYYGADGRDTLEVAAGTVLSLTTPATALTDGGVLLQSLSVSVEGIPGDFNGDLVVDARDYLVWRENFGAMEDGTVLSGNGDGGVVGNSDYDLWSASYGTGQSASESSAPVPEPHTLILLAGFVAPAVAARSRR